MLLEFIHDHEGWKAGDIADVEMTLARRLVGIGKARFGRPPRAEIPGPAVERAASRKAGKKETAVKVIKQDAKPEDIKDEGTGGAV